MGYLKRINLLVFSLVSSLLISGCSVKPEPFHPDEIKKSANKDLEFIKKISPPILEPITLEDAINRAIKNNIRNKIKIMETALSQQQIDLVYYDMLPSLTTSAGYSKRDNFAASASTSFSNGSPDPMDDDPSYSVSQDKQKTSGDISFSWNILDFGLSYVKAQQQADKYLMAKQNEKKVMHNIVQEVRRTYYKAISSEALLKKIIPMMKDVELALEDSNKVKELRINSPMESLAYQRDLLEVLRSLQSLERTLMGAKIELAELMGLKAGTQYSLSQTIQTEYKLPKLNLSLKEMELIALENRPEILESKYKERITHKETTRAILQMLPGIKLNTNISFDDNNYLLNNNWSSYGASISWNLLNIFKANSNQRIAKTKIAIAREQKLAISMAVLSQVHLSLANFEQAKKEYFLSHKYLDVAQEIFKLTEVTNNLNMNSRLVFIKEKLNYILALLRHSSSYANVQNSYGRIFASLGTYEDINKDVFSKNSTIKEVLKKIERKDIKKEEIIELINVAITKKNVYLKISPEPNSDFNIVLPKNKKIEIMKEIKNEYGEWIETSLGFIHKKDVFIKGLKKDKKLKFPKVSLDTKNIFLGKAFKNANIREEANWQSDISFLLPKDRTISISEVVANNGDIWYKTSYGYVSNLVIDIEEEY